MSVLSAETQEQVEQALVEDGKITKDKLGELIEKGRSRTFPSVRIAS